MQLPILDDLEHKITGNMRSAPAFPLMTVDVSKSPTGPVSYHMEHQVYVTLGMTIWAPEYEKASVVTEARKELSYAIYKPVIDELHRLKQIMYEEGSPSGNLAAVKIDDILETLMTGGLQ